MGHLNGGHSEGFQGVSVGIRELQGGYRRFQNGSSDFKGLSEGFQCIQWVLGDFFSEGSRRLRKSFSGAYGGVKMFQGVSR